MKTIVIPVFLQVTLILINVFGLGIPKTENDLEKRDKQEYFFASGLKEIEAIQYIKQNNQTALKNFLKENNIYKVIKFISESYTNYKVDQIVSNLSKDNDFYKVIENMNLKHAGLYLGTEEKGKIFE